MAHSSKFSAVENAILLGLNNVEKWYRKTDDTDVYFVCLGMFLLLYLLII